MKRIILAALTLASLTGCGSSGAPFAAATGTQTGVQARTVAAFDAAIVKAEAEAKKGRHEAALGYYKEADSAMANATQMQLMFEQEIKLGHSAGDMMVLVGTKDRALAERYFHISVNSYDGAGQHVDNLGTRRIEGALNLLEQSQDTMFKVALVFPLEGSDRTSGHLFFANLVEWHNIDMISDLIYNKADAVQVRDSLAKFLARAEQNTATAKTDLPAIVKAHIKDVERRYL